MRHNGISPRLALGMHNSGLARPELGPEDWLSLFKYPVIQTNEPAAKSAGVTAISRLALTGVHASAELDQLVQELTHLCQAAWTAYEQGQHLQRVVRPFLPRTTWNEATAVTRRGGRALPIETGEASILRLDIANFTALTDSHPLDQVVADLNACLDTLTGIVYRHRGDVNKYLGDGFLAVFDNADDALQAGCALQRAVADFNRHQSALGRLVFPTRIGVDTGQVALASLGSYDRQDRTVIGMPVNLAERLQKQAPPDRVWLSQATFDRLQDQSGCRAVGLVKVKGRQEPIFVYEKR
jgi:class 3 adenylate cyclase